MLGWFLQLIQPPKRRIYCWRCGRFVRGLREWDHFRYESIAIATKREMNAVINRGEVIDETRETELMKPMEEACRYYAGEEGIDPWHLLQHRIKSFGPPCQDCGRNLRTPKARRCMECGREK